MSKTNECRIDLKDVSLIYDLNYSGVNTLKDTLMNVLHFRKKHQHAQEKLYAINKMNLTIEHGERLGIIGLNGAGKSTLLKVISGILVPQKGKLEIEGSIQPLIEIGAGFNPEFSGRENIYLNGSMLGFTKKQIKEKEDEIIEFTELGHFIDIPVKYYSSGMSVRLAFTIATIIKPEILLMDEMLSAGDLSFIEKAKKRMNEILEHAKILVLVSHDLGLVQSLTTRTIVLNKGKIIFDGPTEAGIKFYHDAVAKADHQ